MNATVTTFQDDTQFLRRFVCEEDGDAFCEITRLHAGMVYGTCLRITGNQDHAADAAQETFFHLLKHARRVTGSLGGWLHRVAVRRSIDLVRRDATRRRHESAFAAADIVETDQWADVAPLVDEAIGELEEDLRDILLRHYLEGHSTVQIAAATGVSQPTISRRIEQALEMLRGKLRAKGVLVSATALVGLMPNAMTSAPAMVLRELGKIALTSAGTAVGGVAVTMISGLKMKVAALTTVAVLGVSGYLAYQHNRNSDLLRSAAGSADPAVAATGLNHTPKAAKPFATPRPATPIVARMASVLPVSMAVGSSTPTPADGAAPTPTGSPPGWGEAVEGVQVRLRASQTTWTEGAIPRLFVHVRNLGTRHLVLQPRQKNHYCELEVHGEWFCRPNSPFGPVLPAPFPPGRRYDNLVVDLDRFWTSPETGRLGQIKILKLTPGKHTFRVAITATDDTSEPAQPVRAISNPVEIEIISAPDKEKPPR